MNLHAKNSTSGETQLPNPQMILHIKPEAINEYVNPSRKLVTRWQQSLNLNQTQELTDDNFNLPNLNKHRHDSFKSVNKMQPDTKLIECESLEMSIAVESGNTIKYEGGSQDHIVINTNSDDITTQMQKLKY